MAAFSEEHVFLHWYDQVRHVSASQVLEKNIKEVWRKGGEGRLYIVAFTCLNWAYQRKNTNSRYPAATQRTKRPRGPTTEMTNDAFATTKLIYRRRASNHKLCFSCPVVNVGLYELIYLGGRKEQRITHTT